MAQPVLKRSRIVPGIGLCVAAGMPQHMDVNQEVEAGALPNAFNQPINSIRREWTTALSAKDVF